MQTDFTNENLGADRFDLWWVLLVTGVLWLVVALVVLRFTERSTATVGLIVGVVLVGAGVNEFLIAGLQRAWRWFHVVMGLLLLAGGLWASQQLDPARARQLILLWVGFAAFFRGISEIATAFSLRSARAQLAV